MLVQEDGLAMANRADDAFEDLRQRADAVLREVLPNGEALYQAGCIAGPDNPLAFEIADRIVGNARIVEGSTALLRQVLIVLADYQDHAWARGKLYTEGARIGLADRILKGYST